MGQRRGAGPGRDADRTDPPCVPPGHAPRVAEEVGLDRGRQQRDEQRARTGHLAGDSALPADRMMMEALALAAPANRIDTLSSAPPRSPMTRAFLI